ncbi:MAG: OmpH family outer membrane protein [Saprospiraceae bacterium]|nr:OmpH family outer membrane protein [Saprospiraceae bacterium]
MKRLIKAGSMALLCLLLSNAVQAQKFGYLNSAAVLSLMPEMKQAESSLEVTKKQYQERGKKMIEDLQMQYQEVQKKQAEGALSPKQMEEEEGKLMKAQEDIQNYEQEMVQKIQEKRNQVLEPLLTRINDAIQAVAKENNYQFIFDASPGSGILLYADDSTNVTKMVLDKLGIKMPEEMPEPKE